MQNQASLFVPHTAQYCSACAEKNVMSLSFIDEAKEIKSQDLCSVSEQEEPGTQKCL